MPDSHELPAVESLLTERDAILGWLARLEQRGGRAPSDVRERVRRDYQERLDGVTDRLREHAQTVEQRLGADQAEHDALMARARTAREQLAEVELRHEVGEYDAERFETERAAHVATLDELEGELATVGERIARLEEVHALITAPAVVPEEEEAAEPAAEPEPEVAEAAVDEAETEDTAGIGLAAAVQEAIADPSLREPDEAAGEQTPSIIDLGPSDAADAEELLAIFDEPVEAVTDDPAAAAESEPEPEPDDEAESDALTPHRPEIGPLTFIPRAERAAPPPPPIGMAGADQTPRFVRPGARGGSELVQTESSRPAATQVFPDPEPVLPEVPATSGNEPAARTLRCGECGAMNRPLEWYCEKCGAELTAV